MSTVIDASVVVAALVDSGPHGDSAEGVLAGEKLHAPHLVLAEATNIFCRLERAKLITTSEANGAHEDLMQLDIELFVFEPFADVYYVESDQARMRSMCAAWSSLR